MSAFADTNWLVAAYFNDRNGDRTAIVERYARKHSEPWRVSPVVLLECENVFRHLAGEASPPELNHLKADLGFKLVEEGADWREMAELAVSLYERFAPRVVLGTWDAVTLALARARGATAFLSFDKASKARAVAAAMKLEVVPPLAAAEKAVLASLR